MTPVVTVIMSCFNAERFLKPCIESLRSQSLENIEILIIDDGSTDRTREILNDFLKIDTRIKVFTNENNQGLTRNLNALIKKAKGKFIARMDADDVCQERRLEKQMEFLESNNDISVVGSNCLIFDENDIQKGERIMPETNEEIVKKLLFFNCLNHPTVMLRSQVLKENLYDETFRTSQDWELWLRLSLKNFKMYNIQEPLLKYRVESDYLRKRKASYRLNELSIKSKHKKNYPLYKWIIACMPTLILIAIPDFVFPFLKKIDPRK